MKKLTLILLIFFTIPIIVNAQKNEIAGKITINSLKPIIMHVLTCRVRNVMFGI